MSESLAYEPHVAAEKAVLGAMILSPGTIGEIVDKLTPEHFLNPVNGQLYRILRDRYAALQPIDAYAMTIVLSEMPGPAGHSNMLLWIGGASYLSDLIAGSPVVANAVFYADAIIRAATFRNVTKVGERILQLGREPSDDPEDVVSRVIAEAETLRIGTYVHSVNSTQAVALALEAMRTGSDRIGVTTGFLGLDDLVGHFSVGDLVVVAGRPGMGKSVFASDLSRTFAMSGERVLYASLEMPVSDLTLRNLSALSGVSHVSLRSNTLSAREYDRFNAAIKKLTEMPLTIWDKSDVGLPDLRTEVLRHHPGSRPRVLVIDYIQLMRVNQRLENRQAQVADLSRGLKLLAKELGLVVIAVAQLNRGPEQRIDKRPMLSDLRESGAVEQDADVVAMIHRPEYYAKGQQPGEAIIDVVKCRNGRTGEVAVAAKLATMHFDDTAIPR